MPKEDRKVPPETSLMAPRRGRVSVVLFILVLALAVAIGVMVSRGENATSATPSNDRSLSEATTTTTVTKTSMRAQITSRIDEILKVRDRALLTRNARLLTDIYTVDCQCLTDGKSLIQQLRRENIVWKGVSTGIAIQSVEEVNDRLWVVVAIVTTPPVRIETESGSLIRIVPAERNRVRFALAKPTNEEEWLLGHASSLS
jgi:hypothetical protein